MHNRRNINLDCFYIYGSSSFQEVGHDDGLFLLHLCCSFVFNFIFFDLYGFLYLLEESWCRGHVVSFSFSLDEMEWNLSRSQSVKCLSFAFIICLLKISYLVKVIYWFCVGKLCCIRYWWEIFGLTFFPLLLRFFFV